MSLAPPDWVYQWSQIIGALGSIIISIFLAILYKRQQKQLAADHKALLEVSDVDWDGDTATLKLSNFGNGVATNLSLTTLVSADNGEHRKYVTKSNHLKREDKSGTWSNTIQSNEEDILFKGKSRIGEPSPQSYSRDWSSLNFSMFVSQMKAKNVNELKYLHVVVGAELSDERCFATVNSRTGCIYPQNFEREHSLENLPGVKVLLSDETFLPYLHPSFPSKFLGRQYFRGVRFLNWIPFVSVRLRPLDASGKRKVKRVILRRNIKDRIDSVLQRKQG